MTDPTQTRGLGRKPRQNTEPNQPPAYSNSWAILIGISQYQHLNVSPHAAPDAQALYDFLVGYMGFSAEKVFLLSNEAATRQAIEELLIDTLPSQTKREDRVLLFFAGHIHKRYLLRSEIDYLAPVDAQPDVWHTFLDIDYLLNTVNQSAARHIFYIFATGYSPTLLKSEPDHQSANRHLRARQFLSAAPDGVRLGIAGRGPHSHFTRSLIQGLIGGTKSRKEPFITATRLATYLQQQLEINPDVEYRPIFGALTGYEQGGEFIFTFHPSNASAIVDVLGPTAVADIELRVTYTEENKLDYRLRSRLPEIGYEWRSMGSVSLQKRTPFDYMTDILRHLDQMVTQAADGLTPHQTQHQIKKLERIGEGLYDDLIPPRLQDEYWKRLRKLRDQGTIHSLCIQGDEHWIPWELLKPYYYDEDSGEELSDDFLSETFQMSHESLDGSSGDSINIPSARSLIPHLVHIVEKYRLSLRSKR